jgi:CRP/FNR family transcriptional regulator, cyclic AMP receptor protein
MEELDFTSRPARSAIYDPAVARACFERFGEVEVIPQTGQFFTENQGSDRMYLLVEGEVGLIRGRKMLDTVRAGEIFGEMAAISRLPRSATAAAKTACRALSLDAKQFQHAIQQAPEFALMLMNITINRLRLTAALVSRNLAGAPDIQERRVFDGRLLDELAERLPHPPAHHPLNKVIMKEGEAGVFMYVVVAGRVAVSIKSRPVEFIGPGGVFGEMALVDRSPRAATAVAQTDCELLSINRNDFLGLVKTNPAFAVSLLRALADRLRFMTSHHK